jgi:hypothetical protein
MVQNIVVGENREVAWVAKKKAIGMYGVEGLVIANQWDENGKIIGIAIHTNKEEVYLVAPNRIERELLRHLKLKVGVKGKIMQRPDGSKLIHVKSFKPIVKEGK